jgi:hypothetical protein
VTTIERALFTAQRRRKYLLLPITVVTAILSFVIFDWSNALLLTIVVFLLAWGLLSDSVEQIEDLRSIRRNR